MNPGTLSASKIKTFQTCPLQYYAKYELKLKEPPSKAANLGTAVHEVLELLLKTHQMPSIKEICDKYEVADADRDLVKKLVVSTLKNNYLDNSKNTHDLEYKFELDIQDGIKILGYIDRLDINDDIATVIDIKTSKYPFTKKELKNNIQSKMYAVAVSMLFPEIKKINTIFWFVRNQERQIIENHLPDCDVYKQEIIDIHNEILNTEAPPVPKKHKWCGWCVYNDQCPLFQKPDGYGLIFKKSF